MELQIHKTNKYFYLSVINKHSGNIIITKSFLKKDLHKTKIMLEILHEAGIENIIIKSTGKIKFHGNLKKVYENICGDSSIGRV